MINKDYMDVEPTKRKNCKSDKYEPERRNGWKERRQKNADKRQAERDERTARHQIELLDRRLGKGVGAKKERKRLKKQLQKPKRAV